MLDTFPSFSASRASRSSSTSSRPSLSLDLSNLPPLSKPSPPSNTLLITNLHDLSLFQPSSLDTIRTNIINTIAPLNSFSPLPSLRRIIVSFHTTDAAIALRKMLDGQPLLDGHHLRTKIYFGENTPIINEAEAKHPRNFLQAPQVDKLFFISPPPSPPHGWVMRAEDPPNKEVHASDLADALSKLKTEQEDSPSPASANITGPDTPVSLSSDKRTGSWPLSMSSQGRSRSSTLIYHPEDHGSSPALPAVMVEDTTSACVEEEPGPIDMGTLKKMPPKTTRPPVELIE